MVVRARAFCGSSPASDRGMGWGRAPAPCPTLGGVITPLHSTQYYRASLARGTRQLDVPRTVSTRDDVTQDNIAHRDLIKYQ